MTLGNPEDPERLRPHEARERRKIERQLAFMDLVHSGVDTPEGSLREFATEDKIPRLSPEHVLGLIESTWMSFMLPEPGVAVTSGKIRDLVQPGEYGSPEVLDIPSSAAVRRTVEIEAPETGFDEDSAIQSEWSYRFGIVFGHDTRSNDDRTVTGEIEVGVMLRPSGFTAYRQRAIVVDYEGLLIENIEEWKVPARCIDDFIANMQALVGAELKTRAQVDEPDDQPEQ